MTPRIVLLLLLVKQKDEKNQATWPLAGKGVSPPPSCGKLRHYPHGRAGAVLSCLPLALPIILKAVGNQNQGEKTMADAPAGKPKTTAKAEAAPAPKPKTAPPGAGQAKRPIKVLIAEDNPVVRKGLNNFATKWGFEPVEAENGDDAWQRLESDPTIRLAILDWNLPGLTGMQICQRLRTKRPKPYVYALIFSARKSDEEQLLALEGGADDYLAKPAKPSLLRARLGVGLRIIDLLDDKS